MAWVGWVGGSVVHAAEKQWRLRSSPQIASLAIYRSGQSRDLNQQPPNGQLPWFGPVKSSPGPNPRCIGSPAKIVRTVGDGRVVRGCRQMNASACAACWCRPGASRCLPILPLAETATKREDQDFHVKCLSANYDGAIDGGIPVLLDLRLSQLCLTCCRLRTHPGRTRVTARLRHKICLEVLRASGHSQGRNSQGQMVWP